MSDDVRPWMVTDGEYSDYGIEAIYLLPSAEVDAWEAAEKQRYEFTRANRPRPLPYENLHPDFYRRQRKFYAEVNAERQKHAERLMSIGVRFAPVEWNRYGWHGL